MLSLDETMDLLWLSWDEVAKVLEQASHPNALDGEEHKKNRGDERFP
jgi:hypothetical protein